MFDSKEELLEKIRLGEDTLLELKAVRFAGSKIRGPERNDLADEIAAFANFRAGVLVLGVDDKTRRIEGIPLEKLDSVEALVREVVRDSLDPPLNVSIVRRTLPDDLGHERAVIKIDIPRSLFVHRSPGGYFQRVGSSRRSIPTEALARLFQQRSQTRIVRFDEQAVAGATLDDLDEGLWDRFRTPRTHGERDEFLEKQGMARRDEDGVLRPTVAGVLLSTRDPRRFLPNAFIQAVAYAGSTTVPGSPESLYQLDARDLSGPLDQQVVEGCRFVVRNSRIGARRNLGRVDLPAFDLTSVFEALVNAVAHRDYSIYGSKIRLRLFDDRLVLYSPGALPNTMEVESMRLRQSARNEVITSLLARCPVPEDPAIRTDRNTFMDKRGEGVPLILDRSEALAGRPPKYRLIDDVELELEIPAAGPFDPEP
ncbi:MAG TPA: ATP-binding protein [Thermoanaerobaculia bacterium]|nr:ATP-binding protein [Thermoanaerobaculia bacterium]